MEESDTDFTCRGHDFLESIQKYIEFLKGAEPKEREQFADDILSSANSLDAFVDEIAEMYKVSDKHKVFNSILCGYCNVENSWDWDKFGQCSDEPEPCKSYELKWLLDQIRGYAKEIKKFAEKKNLTNISI
jgi:hypothetical protein